MSEPTDPFGKAIHVLLEQIRAGFLDTKNPELRNTPVHAKWEEVRNLLESVHARHLNTKKPEHYAQWEDWIARPMAKRPDPLRDILRHLLRAIQAKSIDTKNQENHNATIGETWDELWDWIKWDWIKSRSGVYKTRDDIDDDAELTALKLPSGIHDDIERRGALKLPCGIYVAGHAFEERMKDDPQFAEGLALFLVTYPEVAEDFDRQLKAQYLPEVLQNLNSPEWQARFENVYRNLLGELPMRHTPSAEAMRCGQAFLHRMKNDPEFAATFVPIKTLPLQEWWRQITVTFAESAAEFEQLEAGWLEKGFDPFDPLDDIDGANRLCKLAGVDPKTVSNRFQLFEIAEEYFRREVMRLRIQAAAAREAAPNANNSGDEPLETTYATLKPNEFSARKTCELLPLRSTVPVQETVSGQTLGLTTDTNNRCENQQDDSGAVSFQEVHQMPDVISTLTPAPMADDFKTARDAVVELVRFLEITVNSFRGRGADIAVLSHSGRDQVPATVEKLDRLIADAKTKLIPVCGELNDVCLGILCAPEEVIEFAQHFRNSTARPTIVDMTADRNIVQHWLARAAVEVARFAVGITPNPQFVYRMTSGIDFEFRKAATQRARKKPRQTRVRCELSDRSLIVDEKRLASGLTEDVYAYFANLADSYPEPITFSAMQQKSHDLVGVNQSRLKGGVTLKGSTPGMTEHDQVTVKGSHSMNLFFGVAYDTLVASVWTFGSRRRRR